MVLYTRRFVWVVLLGFLAGLLSHPLCPFPRKLEDTGETHRFPIASIFGVLFVWDFESRFSSLLGVRLGKGGLLPIPVGTAGT